MNRSSEPIGVGDSSLLLESVGLERRGHCLVEQLDIRVEGGDALAIMGPSGAGKTTLLRTIAGLASPQAGRIERSDGPVSMVFQDPRLLPWRTALDNVALVASGPNGRVRAKEWLDKVGLGEAAEVFPGALSGGMRQRVAIARALVAPSWLILVDEPFANLDAKTAERLRSEFMTYLETEGRTSVWVTHDPLDAAISADRTLLMAGPPTGRWRLVEHKRSDLTQEEIVANLKLAAEELAG